MNCRKWIAMVLVILLAAAMPVYAERMLLYTDFYMDAVKDAIAWHNELMKTDLDSTYNQISYALFDITGDGFDELIICQYCSKHSCEIWIYGTDGNTGVYMGGFECDTSCELYGYKEGMLYLEAYKGYYTLRSAQWNGQGFSCRELVSGEYNGDAPEIVDLSAYYDRSQLLGAVPPFTDLEEWPIDYSGNNSDSGGNTQSDIYDLSNYGYRTVRTKGRGSLVFQTSPGGSFLMNYKFWDGDTIYVNLNWRQNGYAIAYQNGTYGYVDASYIDWGGNSGGGSQNSGDERYDLSNFEYRYVVTKGRGSLVFQTSPGGPFLKDYKFLDGDMIYVNVYWCQSGYAIAYQNGTYGYVDASYIDW